MTPDAMELEQGASPWERFDVRRAHRATGVLAAFNDAGVLVAGDVHVATRLSALVSEDDERVLLAAALAVRAPRLGHVCVDLGDVATAVSTEIDGAPDLASLPWPPAATWRRLVVASPLVADGEEAGDGRPLRLVGDLLYLSRNWSEERQVAQDLLRRADAPLEGVDVPLLRRGLDELFPEQGDTERDDAEQRLAAATSALRRLTVVAGGPGTGKTRTVARILALLCGQVSEAGPQALPRIALAAPTGKAAARLGQEVGVAVGEMPVPDEVRKHLKAVEPMTLHRLLGWRPDSHSRFRHDRRNRLPHDVVIVDETSMVSLSMMARVVEAVRDQARLVLVGDPRQLASVEAGAVLGDVVGPAAEALQLRPHAQRTLADVTRHDVPSVTGRAPIGDGIVVLRTSYRYSGAIAKLAEAVQRGDDDAVMAILGADDAAVQWVPQESGLLPSDEDLGVVRERVVATGRRVVEQAARGDDEGALAALTEFRVLCAHRRGPYGVASWAARVEGWLAAAMPGYGADGRWYVGRPLLVTRNDRQLGLSNGDTGVVVRAGDGVTAAFERRGKVERVGPSRLDAVESVHAMTIHKAQGSQFGAVAVVLPDADSPILSRELCYTALTRAEKRLIVVGSEAAVRTAVRRPIARASGLRARLWEQDAPLSDDDA